ncbi:MULTISPECIES: cell envelope integrity protein TolA [unclassified Pseudomonas]|jgi:colicin import membrane protein|uniref:cell envelope integrity protein TolA n=1 Tax=unclassified Pseudomonas TaxID=196821 RepID=UPI000EA99E92|nr:MULTISPECIES: cell envelope integrity protein TolA [unclassified Pseudomonas]AYF90516.1 cell envelope integrity protein TolA [Pseudomonas sp. DY-1]MDH4651683.1 cell envelope integrity protein TolA [Pseudomonas sp. BN606]MRK22923.1 cell envelope integrity protein TolA [Pseudomonas sp. JG-B]
MQQQSERSSSESYFWPTVWAVSLHVLMFGMLFVSFAFTPELPPSRPIVQATLYQLKSQSQATTQTNQKIAGEAKKTSAPQFETEQMEQKKAEEQKVAAAKAAEQKKADEARKAEEAEQKAEEAKQAAEAKKADEAKKAEEKKQADFAKKKAEEEAKKKAAEEAKKKAAEEAKKKAAEEAKKKAAAEAAKKKAAEDAKKKATADAAKKKAAEEAKRKATEDKKAAALAELLSEDVGRQQALADEVGDQVAGSLDDLIIKLVSEQWRRPPSARNGMSVEVLIEMLPDGTITNASVTRSSGDSPFDSSAVSAVRSVGRIPEMQQLDRATFDQMYRQRRIIFKPEDLGL